MLRRHFVDRWQAWWASARRFVIHDVLHADDPPHRLALGVAVGMFVMFTPTIGIQMMLVVLCASVVGANRTVGIPVVWISNPATLVPIFYPCYVLGVKLLGCAAVDAPWWKALTQPPNGWYAGVTFYWERFMQIAAPLWVGGIVVGLLTAIPTYAFCYWGIRTYRLRRWGQLVPPSYEASPHGSAADLQ